jgi:hypothetical protein
MRPFREIYCLQLPSKITISTTFTEQYKREMDGQNGINVQIERRCKIGKD